MGTYVTYKSYAKSKVYLRGKCPSCGVVSTWKHGFEGKGSCGGKVGSSFFSSNRERYERWEAQASGEALSNAMNKATSAVNNSIEGNFADIHLDCTCQNCGKAPIWGDPPSFAWSAIKSAFLVLLVATLFAIIAPSDNFSISVISKSILNYIICGIAVSIPIAIPIYYFDRHKYRKKVSEFPKDELPVIGLTEEEAVIVYELKQKLIKEQKTNVSPMNQSEQQATLKKSSNIQTPVSKPVVSPSATSKQNLFCRKCGVKIPIDSSFCPSCGEKVVK